MRVQGQSNQNRKPAPPLFSIAMEYVTGHAIDYQIIHVQVYTGTIPIDIKFLLYFQTSTCFLIILIDWPSVLSCHEQGKGPYTLFHISKDKSEASH